MKKISKKESPMPNTELIERSLNTIRFLAADGVQQANSGHPGLPMGCAAIAYTLFTRHLKFNPQNPQWADRDRFILSGGHGSMLLYAMLHLTGYDLPLDELKHFRQWGSLTPGHPEVGLTPGVEVTTGPLGQGFATGVGMAIAEAHLAAVFNQDDRSIVDHFIYAIVTDGDLMEGVASEAASWAGHLQLGKLIYLYDDNHISIDGSTDLSFTEDRAKRFESYGWHTQIISDGNDVDAIDRSIAEAKTDPRPSIILVRTTIGFGAPTRAGTSKAHGEPLGDEELNTAKTKANFPVEPRFFIPDDVLTHFRESVARGQKAEDAWRQKFESYKKSFPEKAKDFERRFNGELPVNWNADLPLFPADPKGLATRASSGKTLTALAARMPELIGGSADLTPSNNTSIASSDFQKDNHAGRYLRFGVREHAMGAAMNGMALHGGVRPFGGTFLMFADYMRPAIRLAALSHIPAIYVFTHDSIGVGEDGPTHQPVEHYAALRAIPNLTVIRPADANETVEAWKIAIQSRHTPTALLLTRQNVPTFERDNVSLVGKGAYVLKDFGEKIQLILMASGSEVSLIMDAAQKLYDDGIAARVISFPSWELFEKQDAAYRASIIIPGIKAMAVEAGVAQGWEKYSDSVLSLDRYGASAPAKILFEQFGFTVENVVAKAKELLK
jgi:transketolase